MASCISLRMGKILPKYLCLGAAGSASGLQPSCLYFHSQVKQSSLVTKTFQLHLCCVDKARRFSHITCNIKRFGPCTSLWSGPNAGLCQYINKFTRFSGELFGMLIAILFMQQAIKGVVQVCSVSCHILPKTVTLTPVPSCDNSHIHMRWLYCNQCYSHSSFYFGDCSRMLCRARLSIAHA